eukprot:c39286_g1_i1 orf=96-269(+)
MKIWVQACNLHWDDVLNGRGLRLHRVNNLGMIKSTPKYRIKQTLNSCDACSKQGQRL